MTTKKKSAPKMSPERDRLVKRVMRHDAALRKAMDALGYRLVSGESFGDIESYDAHYKTVWVHRDAGTVGIVQYPNDFGD